MDGLFVVIAIVVGIFKFAAEQQKKQQRSSGQSSSRQRSLRPQETGQRMRNIPEPLKKALMDLENGWNEGLQGPVNKGIPEIETKEEGLEQEDRRKAGSLNYTEPSDSSEGACDEHPFHLKTEAGEGKAANRNILTDADGGFLLDITEEELLKSIVMAEVLGPPRAMKRRIR